MRATLRNLGPALAAVALLLGRAAPAPTEDYDPFSPANRAPARSPTPAPPAPGKQEPAAKVVTFTAAAEPKEVTRGTTFRLTIAGTPKDGYHTYPITRRADNEIQEGQLSRLKYQDTQGLKPLWPITENEPTWDTAPGVGAYLEHERPFTWAQDILVLPDAEPGQRVLRVTVSFLACDAKQCLPRATRELEVPVEITNAPAVPLTPELKARLDAKEPPVVIVPTPKELLEKKSGPAPGPAVRSDLPKGASIWGLLLASIGAAIAMLFTPCVFPMIPITVSFFLKQSEKEHHKPLATAGVYCLTIIVVLALAVLVLGQLIVKLANNPWLNLGLGGLLILFALSLFGMYEIELPNFIARFTSTREGRGGYAGTFFMALTFTVTSFTCTGPFLGPLLVTAKEFQLSLDRLLIAAFAYSATFAAPFFVMALFPSLLKKLPRSGSWLNSVKVVMGFLELAAALKFLGNMDVALNPGNPLIFTFEAVLCAWIALAVACGLYLFGVYRLPHDSPLASIGVLRMVLGTIFIGLALYMVPALFRKVPQGIVGEGLYAFLPLDTSEQAAPGGTATAEGHLDWHLDYQSAWEQATKEGKPIFIDFTGVNCTNCRKNEKGLFPRKEVREELANFVRVQLYTDSVPRPGLTKGDAEAEADRNRQLQERMFEDVSTPLYAVIYPGKNGPFDGDRLSGQVADPGRHVHKGVISDPADFVQYLKDARQRQVARAGP
jgi:thiol:disulfide interchange protein DsbD